MADVMPSEELIEEPSDFGSLKPGERLGRYELLVPIARGGMARVWAARLHGQRGFQKLVAIKTILPHLANEAEFERMFLDEARIASGVHHPNVCEIYELGEDRNTLYLAMEWVSGDSLSRVLRAAGKTEALDARVVARIVADACAGLHSAHELTDDDGQALGVVHRDLSPHNILLTADGTTKVADFGVAKALGQLHEATSAGQLKGKIAYMAPEQVTGGGVDRRSDVFSLGCVLYEATTGQRPFRGDGDHQVMHAVLKGEYPPPSALLRSYPQELERIVVRALSPQPILRYPTAERMRFALEEFVAKGQLVTQSNVAQVVRARIGEPIERRKERIRQASSVGDRVGDRAGGWTEPPGGMTPSNANQEHGGHRSGVKPSGAHAGRPLYSTMQLGQPSPSMSVAPDQPPMIGFQAGSSAMTPQPPPYDPRAAQGHTPGSYPGAVYPAPQPQNSGYAGQGGQGYPGQTPQGYGGQGGQGYPGQTPQGYAGQGGQGYPGQAPPQNHPFTVPPTSSIRPGPMPPPMAMGAEAFAQNALGPGQGAFGAPALPPGGPHAAPFDAPPPHAAAPSPPGNAHYAIAIGVGVLLAALIGVGGFYGLRGRHKAVVADPTPTAVPVPVPVTPGTEPSSRVASGATASGGARAEVSPALAFRLTPAEAALIVDGKELAPDVRSVPRPAMGMTVTVVARAKGHEDSAVQVDYFTTSPLELTLKPTGAGAAPPPSGAGAAPEPVAKPVSTPAGEEPRSDKDPPKEAPKPKRAPSKAEPIPLNPY